MAKPIEFPQQNLVFAKDQPEYLPLPAFKSQDGTVVTKWELSKEELEEIINTKAIYLVQLTFNAPLQPVRIDALCPFTEEVNASFQ